VNQSVTVVIPAYQAASFIEEALHSVAIQTRAVQRIIVVDDGSTDGTAEVVGAWSRDYGTDVLLIKKSNGGAGSARKLGLENSESDHLMFLDADDRLVPEGIALLHDAMINHAAALVAYGAMRTFVDERHGVNPETRAVHARGPVPLPSSALIRKSAFNRIGHFEPGNFSAIDWFARVFELGPTASVSIPNIVAERRIHASNTSTTTKELTLEYARILKASLDRRRSEESK
jgi:glycosyltransferase involved in cell wall biosynthesis